MRGFPWWQLQSRPDWVKDDLAENDPYRPVAVGIPGKLRIVYIPMCWKPSPISSGIESDVSYEAYYFDPCTGMQVDLGRVEPSPDGQWMPPMPPEGHDWLLVMDAG